MHILFLVSAFLLGSFPTGVVVARAKGVDLRKVGSGNIGTTNVGRALGRRWATLVLLLDAGKGALPVVLATQLFDLGWLPAAAGMVAVLGQVFSIFLKGRGGKGVATSLGAGLALAPVPALLCVILWVALFAAFRISSIGSLAAVASFPTFLWLFHAGSFANLTFAAAVALVVFWRHKDNIRRLVRGEELRA
jgi:acyl phosphate:glycerol-3-phosphate acyltransferase